MLQSGNDRRKSTPRSEIHKHHPWYTQELLFVPLTSHIYTHEHSRAPSQSREQQQVPQTTETTPTTLEKRAKQFKVHCVTEHAAAHLTGGEGGGGVREGTTTAELKDFLNGRIATQ